MPECGVHGLQKVKYLSPADNVLRFTKFENSFPVPFVIYSAFLKSLPSPPPPLKFATPTSQVASVVSWCQQSIATTTANHSCTAAQMQWTNSSLKSSVSRFESIRSSKECGDDSPERITVEETRRMPKLSLLQCHLYII